MLRKHIPLIVAAAFALGCSETAVAPTAQSGGPTLQASASRKVDHRATVGGPDICTGTGGQPGCDANFSLVAIQYADGSVRGEWTDRFSQVNGGGGVHVVVNCLSVVGTEAWVSGVGPAHNFGNLWVTRVRDNGKSAKDPTDQISFSDQVGRFSPRLGTTIQDCNGRQDNQLFDAPQGQAVVVQ